MHSPNPTDLIFRRLSLQAPHHQRVWVRAGIVAALLGYTVAFATIQLEQPWSSQGHPRELYVMAAALVALALERAGRPSAGGALILAALWTEMHLTLMLFGPRAAVGGVLPAVVTGVILMLGPRFGRATALSTVLTVPGVVVLGKLVGLGPGLRPGDLLFLVAIEATTLGVSLLVGLLMSTLGGVLQSAELDARRVRELIDGAPDAILAVTQAGTVDECNPRAEQLLGKPRTQLIGTAFSTLGLEKLSGSGVVDLDKLASEPCELTLRQDGAHPESAGTVEGAARVILDAVVRRVPREDGSTDLLLVLRDLTQRRQAEERAAQLKLQLQNSQKLEALGKLAGGVSHDFNNLLMAVGGYGEALTRNTDTRVQEIGLRLVELRKRAAGLTGQLVAFARKGMTQPEGMNLSSLVDGMQELLPQLMGTSIRLRIDASEAAHIYADPAQLEQVLLNLSLNARDAMPEGGTLTIVCQRVGEAPGRVELCVSDTGTGMDQATQSQAFEPFFTTKPRTRGTGLGLSLVHGIVDASGGTLELKSQPGAGTTFTLSWPSHEGPCQEKGSSRKLLIESGAHPTHAALSAGAEDRASPPESSVSRRSDSVPRQSQRRLINVVDPVQTSPLQRKDQDG